MFQSARLKGIEPPHMVPETTALSTELQTRTTFEKYFSNLDKIYSNIFTLTCKVIFHFGKMPEQPLCHYPKLLQPRFLCVVPVYSYLHLMASAAFFASFTIFSISSKFPFFIISSFTIQLPPQQRIFSKERYSFKFPI